jgi:transcriptional regulator GlxA family with amidase domain
LNVGILIFDQVDLLDVGGPYEVFLTAARLAARDGAPTPFQVTVVGVTEEPVIAYGGLRLVPEATIDGTQDLDLLVVPGAIAIDDVMADRQLMGAVRDKVAGVPVIASVCTGAFILGELGLLDDRPWTTHWEDVDLLAPKVKGVGEPWVRWVDSGRVVTSGGLSSGIAMSLHLVDRFADRELALRTARQIEYDWDPDIGVFAEDA